MKYCSSCGSAVSLRVPEDDNRERYICDDCHVVHYQNPKIVTGCIPEWQDKVLICKRAIEPKKNMWTLPAGFMENGETIIQRAARESFEESNAVLEDMTLFCVYSIPHISQVYTFYRATVKDGVASPGQETTDTRFVTEEEMPWDQLAFRVVIETLKLYYRDKADDDFRVHYGDIIKRPDGSFDIINY